ncbi:MULTISPECIES: hypothetical protein [Nocardioides]|jgi:hypothetical protein|uniref:Uncharacterized protein n=1 Tax=Nocardioides phosphati TaxID=1867775 RepID=A0ABQ2N7Y2_9ACTN|nr:MULTISPECIES: hypothetical protein [Nocardioides]GGO87812.1 hypothetical protein GCM10011584_13330 [Nocardioides phosphati]HSX66980.1 hypothetical protein [Nocardioides sp.]
MNHPITFWGPANHNPENPTSFEAVAQALDLRDTAGFAPEDN